MILPISQAEGQAIILIARLPYNQNLTEAIVVVTPVVEGDAQRFAKAIDLAFQGAKLTSTPNLPVRSVIVTLENGPGNVMGNPIEAEKIGKIIRYYGLVVINGHTFGGKCSATCNIIREIGAQKGYVGDDRAMSIDGKTH